MPSIQTLNAGSHVWHQPHPIGRILAFQNPHGVVQVFAISLGAECLVTGITLIAYLGCDDLRWHLFSGVGRETVSWSTIMPSVTLSGAVFIPGTPADDW